MPINSPDDFRQIIARLGFSHSSLARFMVEMGDDRDEKNVLRSIQRMLAGDSRISGEMRAMLGVMERAGGVPGLPTKATKGSPMARRAKRLAGRQTHPEP